MQQEGLVHLIRLIAVGVLGLRAVTRVVKEGDVVRLRPVDQGLREALLEGGCGRLLIEQQADVLFGEAIPVLLGEQ